jgi:hypothetical protein
MRYLAAVVVILAGFTAGCGDDSTEGGAATTGTVDSSMIEKEIKSQLSGSSVQIASVSCPDDVLKEKGETFNCKAKIDGGGTATVVVTQVNGINRYSYAFKSGTLTVPGASAEPGVERSLEAQGLDVSSVNCPDNIIVKPDSPVTCTAATASGAQVDVTFAFTSEGEVDPSSVETD